MNGTNGHKDWRLLLIAFLVGSSGGGLGHGLLSGTPSEDTARIERKIDDLRDTVERLAVSVRQTDRRLDKVETFQQYVVKPRLDLIRP